MKPTPRKLALLMSIAGLGASLGDSAQARIDPGHDGLAVFAGVSSTAARESSETAAAQEHINFPFAPAAPFDNTLRAADEATLAAARRFFRHEAEARPAASITAVEVSQDGHGAVVAAVAPSIASTADALSYAVVAPVGRSPFGTMPTPVDISGQWVVNGIKVRPAKALAISVKARNAGSAPDKDAETALSFDRVAGPAAQPIVSPSLVAGHAGTAASAADKGFRTSDRQSDPYLALHHQTLAFQETAVSGDSAANVDIALDLAAISDPTPKQTPRIEPKPNGAQDALAALQAVADTVTGAETNITSSPDLDPSASLDLNVEFDAALDLNLDLAADLDLDLDAVSTPCRAGSCPGAYVSASADEVSRIVVGGSHVDRIMRSLEALSSKDGYTPDRFGTQGGEIFVATHSEKVLLTLAATLRRTEAKHGLGATAQIGAPSVDALPADEAVPLQATAEDTVPHEPMQATEHAAGRSVMHEVVALSESNLDQVRGGFETNTGLQMSFGIERAIYVNGSLVTTTSINIAGTGGAVTSQVPGMTGTSASSLTLVQNGAGNTFTTGSASPASLGTIVQNTLDNQKIQGVTAINATVNSLQIVKSQNFESSLRGAIVDSLRR